MAYRLGPDFTRSPVRSGLVKHYAETRKHFVHKLIETTTEPSLPIPPTGHAWNVLDKLPGLMLTAHPCTGVQAY